MADADNVPVDGLQPRRWAAVTEGVGCLALVAVVAALIVPSAILRESDVPGRSCPNGMKQIGLSFKMYANEDGAELMPSPSLSMGLIPNMRQVYPEFIPDPNVMICAKDPRTKDIPDIVEDDPKTVEPYFAASAYFYLGYATQNDDDVERFAQAYRQAVRDRRPLDHDLVAPDDPYGDKTVFRLRGGVERSVHYRGKRDMDIPGETKTASQIPVLIERTGNHEKRRPGGKFPGGNVLFLDGHVEYIEYPGKWPMTEKTMRLLDELDALRADPSSR